MTLTSLSDKALADTKHRYRDPRTGEVVTSVTRIVGSFDDGDKIGAGAGAAVKLTKAGLNYRQVWNDKRDLGSRIHEHCAAWAMGMAVDVLPSDEPYMNAVTAFCRAKKPEWVAVERSVVSSLGYGGRFDAVCFLDGISYLLDFKTGRAWPLELSMQLAAYRFADGMVRYDASGNASGLDPMPFIERCAGLYLGEDGVAQLVEVDADQGAFEAFKHLLAVRQWADKQSRREA